MGMRRTITLYIVKELLTPLVLSVAALSFILLMNKILRLTELVVNKGVAVGSVVKLFAFLLPTFLYYTIPIATLLAVLIAFNRLSSDNEITALKASGVSLYQMLPAVGIFAAGTFILGIFLSVYLVPSGNFAFKSLLFQIARSKATLGIKEQIFNNDFKGLTIYVNKIPRGGQYMEGVMVSDERRPREASLIVASRGRLITDPDELRLTLRLEQGSMHRISRDRISYSKMDFANYDLSLNLDSSLSPTTKKGKGLGEMPLAELMEEMDRLKGERRRQARVEFHKKFAFPFAVLAFALVGMPLGVLFRQAGRLSGFTLGLGVLFIYYLLFSAGEQLALAGLLPPIISIWAADLLFVGAGSYLLVLTAQERELEAALALARRLEAARRYLKGLASRFVR